MEKDYRFSDYYTLASINYSFPKPEVCFGHLIHLGRIDTVYLYIAKNKDYGFTRKLRHNFTLSFIELKKLIRLVKSIYPFKYKITSTTHDKEEYYKIKLTFNNFNKASVLFVLTALRYSYEFPFNVICSDAFKLMQVKRAINANVQYCSF